MRQRHKGPAGHHVFRYPIYCDLQIDLQDNAYNYLMNAGYKDADYERALLQVSNLNHRILDPHPRQIHYSKEFNDTLPKGYEEALHVFETCVITGKNLQPFMSKTTLRAGYNDDALNTLGIYHFHLSIRPGDNGFVARNKYLILAVSTDSDFYMLKIADHNTDWEYDRDVYNIIFNNWPGLLNRLKLNGLTVEPLSAEEYKSARKARANVLLCINGQAYMGIGRGVVGDGSSISDVRSSDYWWNACGRVEAGLPRNSVGLVDGINQCLKDNHENGRCIDCLKLKLLWINESECTMLEKQTGLMVKELFQEGRFWVVGLRTYMTEFITEGGRIRASVLD